MNWEKDITPKEADWLLWLLFMIMLLCVGMTSPIDGVDKAYEGKYQTGGGLK